MRTRLATPNHYWHVFFPSCKVNKAREDGAWGDDQNFLTGNYFYTEQEAQIFANKLKLLLKQENIYEQLHVRKLK